MCKILVPTITGQGSELIEGGEMVGSVRESLGNPSTNIGQIWSRIRKFPGHETDWIRVARPQPDWQWITEAPPTWELREEDLEHVSKKGSGQTSVSHMRHLQRGGILPDGSYLSWSDGAFYLDGVSIKVPYRGLSKMLSRKRGLEDINWRQFLFSINLAIMRFRDHEHGPPRDSEAVVHPVHMFLNRKRSSFIDMMYRTRGSRPMFTMPEEFQETEWMRRWDIWGASQPRHARPRGRDEALVPVSLVVSKGRLQLRVRRNSGWRKIELESHPEVWARVITWALSPPDHEDRRRLSCIQQHLFADSDAPLITPDNRRGIGFLRGILESSDRVETDIEGKTFGITGSSGLRYSVAPGRGGHGTRFVVRPLDVNGEGPDIEGMDPRGRLYHPAWRNLCIVETPKLRRLVIGDAIASIVLALLDDLNSQKSIDTLRAHISRNRGQAADPEIEQMNEARWLGERLNRNGVEARVRRCTESFPRLWGVLLRLPLGERATFTAMRGGRPNVSFDDCEAEFTTRNIGERRVMYQMLGVSGWVRDREEERVRGVQRIYIRTGTGERYLGGSVQEICEMLEPQLVVDGRIRLVAAPLWTYFERQNPGTSHLLPGTNQHIE